ncbi:melatonin receptor type 1C-like [Protopterus annectens]|uniref:melatonin receptor type 1C-like n=1 Tax=Protopterus annectens TaxID=7888 RepID=UPI001CFA1BAC|nr:melatonin receptor type 1C-like [Protopterus annectens]
MWYLKSSQVTNTCIGCLLLDTDYNNFPAYKRPQNETVMLASLMIFITVMDILGNVLLIVSVLQNKKLRNAGNIFVISLSVADLMVAVYPYPLLINAILQNRWTLGVAQSKACSIMIMISFGGSMYNIMAIAVNRYCCICHSLSYEKLYSMRNTYYYTLLTWCISIAIQVIIIFFGTLQYNPRLYFCVIVLNVNVSLTTGLALFHFIIPVTVVIICYSRIWILVIQVRYRIRQEGKQTLITLDLKHFVTMFMVFALFSVCWGPLCILGLVIAFSPVKQVPSFPDWIFDLGFYMASFNSCLNGIVYGVFNSNFRQEYIRIIQAVFHFISNRCERWKRKCNG